MGAPTEASTFHGGLHWAAETMSRDELQALQLARLRKTLANARRHVAWHRARLAAVELHPDALRDLLGDPAERSRLAAAGLARAQGFSWQHTVDEHVSLIEGLASTQEAMP